MADSVNAFSLRDIFENFENPLPPEVEEGNIEYKVSRDRLLYTVLIQIYERLL